MNYNYGVNYNSEMITKTCGTIKASDAARYYSKYVNDTVDIIDLHTGEVVEQWDGGECIYLCKDFADNAIWEQG